MEEDFKNIEDKHKILIEKAISIMKQVEDPKHSIHHVLKVVENTKEILNNVKANNEVCIISAYWHDVGRIKQAKGHALISAEMLKEQMQELNYESSIIEECYKAIYKHSWKQEPETLEGIIIRDADKIDFVGIPRWEECINKNSKFNKIIELLPITREKLLKLDISKIMYDRDIVKLIVFLNDKIFDVNEEEKKL